MARQRVQDPRRFGGPRPGHRAAARVRGSRDRRRHPDLPARRRLRRPPFFPVRVRPAKPWVAQRAQSVGRAILMERSSMTQPGQDQEHSTGELVKMMTEQVSVLVRDELKLAQLEMTGKGKQAALGAGMFGASGIVALYGVGCLVACAIIAISGAVAAWLAALIVGAALLAAAGGGALLGKQRLRNATPPLPEQAVADAKADVEEIK